MSTPISPVFDLPRPEDIRAMAFVVKLRETDPTSEGWDQARPCGDHGMANTMIANGEELKVTLDRIARFHEQAAHLRRAESNPDNYRAAVSGFIAEIDRMQLDVGEYLMHHPSDSAARRAYA